jgi:hypothetical protein
MSAPSLEVMKNPNRAIRLGMAALWGVLVSGCSAGTAVLGPADCRPGDSTMACCIKKHPYDPVGACGASPSEIEQALRAVRSDEDEDEDDFANNASLPRWKQKCIRYYNACVNDRWTGKCDDCLRRCEGQHEWPFEMCDERKRR